jgi:hypothetical protein
LKKNINKNKITPGTWEILVHWLTPIRELSVNPSQVIFVNL